MQPIKALPSDFVGNLSAIKRAEAKIESILAETQRETIEIQQQQGRERQDITRPLRWFMVADALAMLCGFILAWGLALGTNMLLGKPVIILAADETAKLAQFLVIAAGVMMWFENTGHYRVRMPLWIEIKKVISALGVALMIDGFLVFASKHDFSRLSLVSGWAFAAVSIIVMRSLYRVLLARQGRWKIPTLIVGKGAMAEEAQAALESESSLGYAIVAQIDDLPLAFAHAGKSWENLCANYGVDYVVIALGGQELSRADQALAQLSRESVPFSVSSPLRHLPVMGMMPQYFFNHDVMMLTRTCGLDQPLPRAIKRGFDILAAGGALLVFGPIFLLLAAFVKLDGGPALFGHKRLGLNGKSFPCLKFRSMVPNGDEVLKRHLAKNPAAKEEWDREMKLRNDPRVTLVGAFLRKTSLDELPQLLNVLRGDMSLVGPRPIVVAETDRYENDIAHYYRVRPGITGLWQVSGRNDVSYAKRVQMDSWYVRNWSLWHDIAIICKTFPVVFKRTGAY
jgi:undecaprenyl-phosphate galactose phosphotransferase